MEKKTEPTVANYRVTNADEVSNLFSNEFMKKHAKSDPLEENELVEYVSTLISHQETDALKLQILLKTATIDPLNEKRNFWIIKKAFEIAPFDGKETQGTLNVIHTLSMLQGYTKLTPNGTTLERYIPQHGSELQHFLLHLKTCIPQSPFLWFYLQYSLLPIAKDEWMLAFNTYHLENMTEVKDKILPHFIEEWLHFSPEFNAICLKFAKALTKEDYALTLEKCGNFFVPYEKGLKEHDGEFYLSQRIYKKITTSLRSQNKNNNDPFEMAFTAFEQGNHKKVIEILTPIVSNRDEINKRALLAANSVYSMLAKSHQEMGDRDKALMLFETVYPRIVISKEHHYGQKEIAFEAIGCLRAKRKANNPKTDFFNAEDTNPFALFRLALQKIEQKKYVEAIIALNDALAYFIPKKGLNSKECVQCYFKLAFSYQELGQLDTAYLQNNMAHALAIELNLKAFIEESKIVCGQLETDMSSQTLEEARAGKLTM